MATPRFYEFGGFRLDAAGRALYQEGQRVPLPPKATEILLALVEAGGNLVSKEELLQRAWPDTYVEEGSLASNISLLRKALGEDEGWIETVPKRGYRLLVPVRAGEAGGAAASWPAPRGRRKLAWVAGVAVLAVAAGALYLGVARPRPPSPPAAPAPGRRPMLVVLPVRNLTGDPERDYLSDGLTDDLIAQLARFNPERLGVIARTSSMAYKNSNRTVGEIGRELGVDYVVEGSLRTAGQRLRINVELVRVSDQTELWAQQYDRSLKELYSLQEEVPRAIAQGVRVELSAAGQSRLSGARPLNPDAYLAYLEGRYYWNQRSPQALERAIVHLKQAVELDPDYAPAHAALAEAYVSQCLIADVPARQVFPLAKAAALDALRLDDGLAEAHTSLAAVKFWYEWDWGGAEAEFRRALALNPDYATAHQWYGEYLRMMGREPEAIAEIEAARALDPLSLIINTELGLPYYLEGDYDGAIRQYQKALVMDPNFGLAHCLLGWAYEEKGQLGEAIRELERAQQLDDSAPVLAALGHAYALAGRRRDAQQVLRQLEERRRRARVSALFFAEVYEALGEKEKALAALEQAYAERDWTLVWLKMGRKLGALKDDPRFAALLARMNFPR